MKKNFLALVLVVLAFSYVSSDAQMMIPDRKAIIDSLTTIDPEIKGYFPRWKICESDLQLQIYRTFQLNNYNKDLLDRNNIEILAAPREDETQAFEILMISCGQASMSATEVEGSLSGLLVGFITGEYKYNGVDRGGQNDVADRDYCYNEIPRELPLTTSQTSAIIDFFQPTNVSHNFTLSAFEQSIKIGETGFWIKSQFGNDDISLPFWTAGESRVILQRPLYPNMDSKTSSKVPYLINAYIGGAYKLTSGIDRGLIPINDAQETDEDNSTVFSWVQKRSLNSAPDGKIIIGMDFHMPFHPMTGININMSLPVKTIGEQQIDLMGFAYRGNDFGATPDPDLKSSFYQEGTKVNEATLYMLKGTGKVSAFYHWWVDQDKQENYLRFDLGISYSEVEQFYVYRKQEEGLTNTYMTNEKVTGLKTFKPDTFSDWMFAKIEYRNNAAWPFGMSVQVANQTLLGRVYIPLFGQWLYLEGKFSTPLRDARPYEVENFFMVSPVIRLNI